MAVTYYHTVDGVLLRKTTSGTRTDFLYIALGSATRTMGHSGGQVNTYTYDSNGNMSWAQGFATSQNENASMVYDKENRLLVHTDNLTGTKTTYTYDGDGLKRSEWQGATRTTLVWDGDEYLQERS